MILRCKLKLRNCKSEDLANLYPERRQALSKSINNLCVPQWLYMAGVASNLDAIDPILLADRPEDVKLYLPSALPPNSRDAQCSNGLPQIEYQLCYAQAANSLNEIRRFC